MADSKPIPLTRYAKEFGEGPSSTQQPSPKTVIKSGLTPLTPRFLVPAYKIQRRRDAIARFQKRRLGGFTTQELFDLDVITNREIPKPSLENPLHPIFQREFWFLHSEDTVPPIPLHATGKWHAQENDAVWEMLQPSLRMASRMLADLHRNPWLDAFLMSERKEIDDDRFSAEYKVRTTPEQRKYYHQSFSLRKPGPMNEQQCKAKLDRIVNIMLPNIGFGINSCRYNPREPDNKDWDVSAVSYLNEFGHLFVKFGYEELEDLMRADLNSGGRLSRQWDLATTVIHELCHVFHMVDIHWATGKFEPNCPTSRYEPFFMDEISSELGFSAEYSFFRGLNQGFPLDDEDLPGRQKRYFGYYQLCWPFANAGINPDSDLISPPQEDEYMWIVSISYYEAMFSENYHRSLQNLGRYWATRSLGVTRSKEKNVYSWTQVNRSPPSSYSQELFDLMNMTTAEAQLYLNAMKVEDIRDMRNLLARRQHQSSEVKAQAEVYQRNKFRSELAKLVLMVENLVWQNKNIVNILPKLERDGDDYVDTRNELQAFNRNLRIFITTLCDGRFPDIEKEFDVAALELENQRLELTDKNYQTGITKEGNQYEATQNELADEEQLEDAIHALAVKDMDKVITLCSELLGNLGTSLMVSSWCRLLLGSTETPTLDERISLLRRGTITLNAVDIPEHYGEAFEDLRDSSEVLLELLEREKMVLGLENTHMTPCRVGHLRRKFNRSYF